MKISIKTIAKLAGCSTATVSNVLNNKGMFSQKTRSRVLEIVKKNNYTRNAIGRNLRTGKTETVGITFYRPNADIFRHEFYLGMMGALERTMAENNYEIILSEYTDTMVERGELPPFLAKGKADGMIALGGFPQHSIELFAHSQHPVVMLDTYAKNVDCVITDGKTAVENAMKRLSELGHKRAFFFGFGLPDYNTDMRIQGFLSGVEKYGFDAQHSKICRNFVDTDGAVKEFQNIINGSARPSVIVSANDKVAVELLSAAKEMGVRVPEDISILGFDDTPISRLTSPKLSTIRTDIENMGRRGALLMLRRLADKDAKPVVEISVPQLIMRDSVARVAGA